jgi:predicted ferric reductase
VFLATLHGVVSIIACAKSHNLRILAEINGVMGIIAGIAMLIILSTALLLRKLRYEVFYVMHIMMFMLILIAVGMHQSGLQTKAVYIVGFTASVWIADRFLRSAKIAYNALNNFATLTPLPHGGTQISLSKSVPSAKAGEHCFLWIPSVRIAETHSFTIVSTQPTEFVVNAHDGFIRDLHAYALRNPGAKVSASAGGPYGHVPSFENFDKVVFIAGGSGGSYCFGVALELLRKLAERHSCRMKKIGFIWVVRNQDTSPHHLGYTDTSAD